MCRDPEPARSYFHPGSSSLTLAAMPVSVNKTSLLREPLPCNLATETALRPLIWCSDGCSSHASCRGSPTGWLEANK